MLDQIIKVWNSKSLHQPGWKDIRIRTFEFVARTQFLCEFSVLQRKKSCNLCNINNLKIAYVKRGVNRTEANHCKYNSLSNCIISISEENRLQSTELPSMGETSGTTVGN